MTKLHEQQAVARVDMINSCTVHIWVEGLLDHRILTPHYRGCTFDEQQPAFTLPSKSHTKGGAWLRAEFCYREASQYILGDYVPNNRRITLSRSLKPLSLGLPVILLCQRITSEQGQDGYTTLPTPKLFALSGLPTLSCCLTAFDCNASCLWPS